MTSPLIRCLYIGLQGLFLPLVWFGGLLIDRGVSWAWLLFLAYEAAIMLDGWLLLRFLRHK